MADDTLKILIIDDSDLDRAFLMEVLRGIGIKNDFLEARTGEEAIEVLGKRYKEIGLIFLDWHLPKISGMEFMAAMVNIPQIADKPIIMITASSSDKNKESAAAANPNLAGYIVKPFTPESLIKAIEKYVR